MADLNFEKCPYHESVVIRLSRLESDMEKWDSRIWVSMWALVGTMATGLVTLIAALWVAYSVPERLEALEVQAKQATKVADQTLDAVRKP